MKKRVIFLTQLKADADVDAYERFLREVDYPRTQELLPVSYYWATRIEGKVIGEAVLLFQYVEVRGYRRLRHVPRGVCESVTRGGRLDGPSLQLHR